MVKSNLIEVIFFPRPRISISGLVIPVDVVVVAVVDVGVAPLVDDVVVALVDDDAVVFVVVELVDVDDWVVPPPHAVKTSDNVTKRPITRKSNLVFTRGFSLTKIFGIPKKKWGQLCSFDESLYFNANP
jgi:hypothetical protein